MDKIDSKILLELLKDSRAPISLIAKKTKLSREVVGYRMEKYVSGGIIKEFFTQINTVKLGYTSALLFLSLKNDAEEELIKYMKSSEFISWAGKQCGKWSIGMAIYGKNMVEVQKIFEEIINKFQNSIQSHLFEFYKNMEFFYEKYFNSHVLLSSYKNKFELVYTIDDYDKKILKLLSKNSRISCIEISKYVPISSVAISQRIKNLEKSKYILSYSIYISPSKIGLYQF